MTFVPEHWVKACRPQASRILRRQRGDRRSWRHERTADCCSDSRLSYIWVSSSSRSWVLVAFRLRCRRARTDRPSSCLPFSINHLGDSGRNKTPQVRMMAGTTWKESGKRQEKVPPRREHPYPVHCWNYCQLDHQIVPANMNLQRP